MNRDIEIAIGKRMALETRKSEAVGRAGVEPAGFKRAAYSLNPNLLETR